MRKLFSQVYEVSGLGFYYLLERLNIKFLLHHFDIIMYLWFISLLSTVSLLGLVVVKLDIFLSSVLYLWLLSSEFLGYVVKCISYGLEDDYLDLEDELEHIRHLFIVFSFSYLCVVLCLLLELVSIGTLIFLVLLQLVIIYIFNFLVVLGFI